MTTVTDLPIPHPTGGMADFARRSGQLRVFFTGGEPLLSPLARPVLEGIPEHDPGQYTTTLITNGLTLTRDLRWLAASSLDRIKVSLHYFSDQSIAAIAEGKPGDIATIKAGIEAAVQVIPAVEINLLLQPQNAHEVNDIISYARRLGVSVQVIELVGTTHNAALGSKISSAEISQWLRTIASHEQAVTTGTGQGKRVFTVTRSPSRSSTPASAATTPASARPAPPATAAPKDSGHCASTPLGRLVGTELTAEDRWTVVRLVLVVLANWPKPATFCGSLGITRMEKARFSSAQKGNRVFPMPTMTVPSAVSREEVATVVASKLGPKRPVSPIGDSDSFHVGSGIFRARVDVVPGEQTTTIKVTPWGLTALRAINGMGIVRKVETALKESELHAA